MDDVYGCELYGFKNIGSVSSAPGSWDGCKSCLVGSASITDLVCS